MTMLVFKKEIEENNLLNPGLLKLLVEIVEDENINVDDRDLFLPILYTRFK